MGISNSQQKIDSFEINYKHQPGYSNYIGYHSLLVSSTEILLKKKFIFENQESYSSFLKAYEKIQRKPFNLIHPKLALQLTGLENCTPLYQLSLYFPHYGNNLSTVVQKQGLLNQKQAWFLLNEVSKSLEILGQEGRAHWGISPQTIYQNLMQNWYIHDSLFILGNSPQSYLLNQYEHQQFISQKMQSLLVRTILPSFEDGQQEDIYQLGYSMVFALTRAHPHTIPRNYDHRQQSINSLLNGMKYSLELVDIVRSMVERNDSKRITNSQLRRILKEKETQIIHYEQMHPTIRVRKNQHTNLIQSNMAFLKTPKALNQHVNHPYNPLYLQQQSLKPFELSSERKQLNRISSYDKLQNR